MATATERLEVIITAKDEASSKFSKLGSMLTTGLKTAAIAGAAGLTALGAGLTYSVKEAMEAQEIQTQLMAVLESTGGAAGVSADMANELATGLSQVTRFSDETVLTGENLLLTFTNIGKDVFPEATGTMLDMSQALGQDLKTSAIQLGKALQDPIQGVGALRRVGVNFTEEQKGLIESLVAEGKLMEAQKMILKELQVEFGGSAEAAGKTFAGQLDILKNTLSNVGEAVGTALLPKLTALVGEFAERAIPIVSSFGELLTTVFTGGEDPIGDLYNLIYNVADALGIMLPDGFLVKLRGFFDMLTPIRDAFAEVGRVIMTDLWPAFKELWGSIFSIFGEGGVGLTAEGVIQAIADALVWVANMLAEHVIPALADFWRWIAQNVVPVIRDQLIPWIKAAFLWIKENVVPILVAVGAKIGEFLRNVANWWREHKDQIIGFFKAIWDAVIGVWNWFADLFKNVFAAFRAAREGDWYEFGQALRRIWDQLWESIKSGITNAWEGLKTAFSWLWEQIKTWFQSIDWAQLGKDIVMGLINGLKNSGPSVIEAVTGVASAIVETFRGFFNMQSPSKLMQTYGAYISEGLAKGMTSGTSGVVSAATQMSTTVVQQVVSPTVVGAPAQGFGGSASKGNTIVVQAGAILSFADEAGLERTLRPLVQKWMTPA